jgi:hypothetical protein
MLMQEDRLLSVCDCPHVSLSVSRVFCSPWLCGIAGPEMRSRLAVINANIC